MLWKGARERERGSHMDELAQGWGLRIQVIHTAGVLQHRQRVLIITTFIIISPVIT
jgi:hypothetical protein